MPAVAGALLTAAISGGGIGFATIALALAKDAVSFGLSALAKPKPPQQRFAERSQLVRAGINPRRYIYGRLRVSGDMVFAHVPTDTSKPGYLHLVIVLAGHEVDAIEDTIWIADDQVTLNASGEVDPGSKYHVNGVSHIRVKKHLGSPDQTADADLIAEADAGAWSADHRLRGCAYVYVRLIYNRDLFADGIPQLRFMVRGRKLYDPRTGLSAWSDNPALVLRDYLTGAHGLGADVSEIDDQAVIAAANICDEPVPLAAGGTTPRYRANGDIEANARPADTIGEILSAMAGELVYSSGRFVIHAGAPMAVIDASHMLGEDDARGPVTVHTRSSRRDVFNTVRGVYANGSNRYQPEDYPVVRSSTAIAEDLGEEIVEDLTLPFTTDAPMAQRLAKIRLLRARQQIRVSFPAKLSALAIQAHDTVTLTLPRFGWVDKKFRVEQWRLAEDAGVDLELVEEDDSIWDWAASEEVAVNPAPATALPDPFSQDPPQAVTATSTTYIDTDGTAFARLNVAVTAPVRAIYLDRYEVEYRESGGAWRPGAIIDRDASPAEADIGGLRAGIAHEVRARAINTMGVRSAWVSGAGTPNADLTPPGNPQYGNASGGINAVTVQWIAPADADYMAMKLFLATSNLPKSSIDDSYLVATVGGAPGQRGEYTINELSPATTYYAYMRAVDRSGNEGVVWGSYAATTRRVQGSDIDSAAVATGHVQDNAITRLYSAVGSVSIPSGTGWHDIAAVTVSMSEAWDAVIDAAASMSGWGDTVKTPDFKLRILGGSPDGQLTFPVQWTPPPDAQSGATAAYAAGSVVSRRAQAAGGAVTFTLQADVGTPLNNINPTLVDGIMTVTARKK